MIASICFLSIPIWFSNESTLDFNKSNSLLLGESNFENSSASLFKPLLRAFWASESPSTLSDKFLWESASFSKSSLVAYPSHKFCSLRTSSSRLERSFVDFSTMIANPLAFFAASFHRSISSWVICSHGPDLAEDFLGATSTFWPLPSLAIISRISAVSVSKSY